MSESEFKQVAIGFFRNLLHGLARSGAKAAARGVDSMLEDAEDHIDGIATRIKAGRQTAQTVGARPTKHVKVEARVVDATLEEDEGK